MLHTLNSFRKSQTLCDVFLVVDNCRLPAHKVVLAASSPVFKAYFTSELTGGKSGNEFKVVIPAFLPDVEGIEELLNYVYTGEVEIFAENAEKLFVLADFFDILRLREACVEFLILNLKPSNCLAIQVFAERYCQLLYEAASEYVCNHLGAIWKTEEFLSSDFEDVKDLICGDRLDFQTQRKEKDVFDGIRSWVKHDPETREQCFPELFSHVRLSAMSLQFITEVIDRDEFVTQSHVSEGLVAAELDARGVTEGVVLLSDNGCTSCYIPTKDAWFDLSRLPSFNRVRAATVCEGKVYAIGWEDDRLTIEKFHPQNNIWSEVLWKISSFPMVTTAMGDCIYLFKENGCVTRYKPGDNSWQDMAPMNSSRRDLCALSLNGLIYAIGGHDGKQGLNSAERYDPNNNHWEYIASMGEKRCFASATVMDNKILVVGGESYFVPLRNCEVYDPTTNAWILLQAKLCVSRSNAAITRTRRKIFVFGGAYSNGIVECYDKDQEEWTEVGQCPSTMSFNNACSAWLPKALFKPLKGVPLSCGTL